MVTRKQNPREEPPFLVITRETLKANVEAKLRIGEELLARQVTTPDEKTKLVDDFKHWDNVNLEMIRNAFNQARHVYAEKYRYVQPIDISVLYGGSRVQKNFKELVDEDKYAVDTQMAKLRQFNDQIEFFQVIPGILPVQPAGKNKMEELTRTLNRFHRVAQAIRSRHDNRETLLIRDEYDVQDLLSGLLQIYFEDIRDEESSPSHAGANTRIDFVLRQEKIILEIKMTKESQSVKKLGEELLIDIGRYKEYPNTNNLVVFIYDKIDHIPNKRGFINDLQKHSIPSFKITVIINPE